MRLAIPDPTRSLPVPGQIEGKVVAYGESGNLVSDIPNDRLVAIPRDSATTACDEHETIGIFPADHPEQPMTFMAILGASGCLELTIVGDSARAMLSVPLGEKVVVKW
jgi:S-adenosylmethionine hydrolase